MEMVKEDNRLELNAQIEELEKKVRNLKQALSDKKEQETAMLQEKNEKLVAQLTQMEKRVVTTETTLEATLQYESGQNKALSSPRVARTQGSAHETLKTHSPTSRESRHRWTLVEEKVLVNAWLNTSKDAVVENEQKGGSFWNRVAAYYAASPSVSNLPVRESNTCKQKWAKINEKVRKFADCYDCASRQRRSGETKDDVMEMAYNLYFQDQKHKFTLEHAWKLLKNDQKWCSLITEKSNHVTKKTKRPEGVAHSSSSNTACQVVEETIERPIGVKAAKAKGKKRRKQTTGSSESSSGRDLEELWIIKEKDLIIKERLANKKLLDSLIAKQGPLSEIEETLKNKLILEML